MSNVCAVLPLKTLKVLALPLTSDDGLRFGKVMKLQGECGGGRLTYGKFLNFIASAEERDGSL